MAEDPRRLIRSPAAGVRSPPAESTYVSRAPVRASRGRFLDGSPDAGFRSDPSRPVLPRKGEGGGRRLCRGSGHPDQLDAEVQKPENEAARTPLRPAAAFYRGVCLAALGEPDKAREEFAIFIAANPEKDIDRKAYPASAVAAFQRARKSSPGAEKAEEVLSSLALAYRSTAFPSESSAPPGPDWTTGPVKHLLRQEENRAFFRLSDGASRTEFVAGSGARGTPGPTLRRTSFGGSSSGASRSPMSTLRKVRRGAA